MAVCKLLLDSVEENFATMTIRMRIKDWRMLKNALADSEGAGHEFWHIIKGIRETIETSEETVWTQIEGPEDENLSP
jgi:hypothetical protein